MRKKITRRSFLFKSAGIGLGYCLASGTVFTSLSSGIISKTKSLQAPFFRRGEKQLFVDDMMIAQNHGIRRKIHAASKLERPVLEADMPWEQGDEYNGKKDRRVYIYGTVLRDTDT